MLIDLFGMQVVLNPDWVIQDGIDWAKVRSPSRALRRQKSGKRHGFPVKWKPNPDIIKMGNKLIMHPSMLAEVQRQIHAEKAQKERAPYFGNIYREVNHG